MSSLQNKVAVITGAGGTLCSEMARSLANSGAKIALVDRTLEKLKIVEEEIVEKGGQAISLDADVTDEQRIGQIRDEVVKQWGPPDILVNGAGGNQPNAVTTTNEFDERELTGEDGIRGFFNLKMEDFHRVVTVNTMGSVIPCFIFGKDMAKAGSGNIINIASMNSFRPLSRVGAYGMAKAGIANFTQWLAAYLAPAHVRVNAIAPGFFLNDRSRKLLLKEDGGFSSRGENIIHHTPMKKFGEASQLLGTLNWLLDDDASGFVTGIVVPVDGGFMACSGV
ncbi:MAG: SDR family oxidoreductase [Cytophagales bacterium]|nr:SDR family oxidoreductase [Cytophagales bacterium]